jgi:hypothetical protein
MKLIRDAQTILGALEDGSLAADLSKEITDTLAALKEHGAGRKNHKAKGKVTLVLDLEVEEHSVIIRGDITSKKPKPARGSSFYFVTDEGALSTEHPQQMNMFGGMKDIKTRETA